MKFENIGLLVPNILLPNPRLNFSDWAVVACDQYSSQQSYWQEVAARIAGKPSTGHLIFPEAWLEQGRDEEIIENICQNMHKYLADDIFVEFQSGLIRCARTLANGKTRRGAIVALDLEQYNYEAGAQTLIRATEGTIVNRLPPRIRIRENAPLEFPHIMVLIDDPERSVIEPLFSLPATPVYDFELMQQGGRIRGEIIQQESDLKNFANCLQHLADPTLFSKKYSTDNAQQPLLYAMGDGNHSFATAKAIWENMKSEHGFDAIADHPARFALVELVNLYDESLDFEAIHRVVFNTQPEALLQAFENYFQNEQGEIVFADVTATENKQVIPFYFSDKQGSAVIHNPSHQLATGSLQQFLDVFLKDQTTSSIDYIHGEETTIALGRQPGNIGFILPPIEKQALFKTVIFDGALPRKTFSMGEAQDKRFYLEGRRIQK